ncbi:Mediator of RNA polymerase II transcription subunit-like protein [Hapsidospora chrysogenum ATCC 11550]|uniref:Mediator of RNA polymerase II transcription subunit 18 n=1 Tax=Hapsidospora chrysogenum (strain ATCC 11550 / CBS 779.69 / DSM 880 / IAM 14645 / JCM 23072 / IMI 49137) TaxID=857340 RepID=A0A086T0B9_HAPC1|nr:Mediator of RNA polymerase II transcription subunit-like protein [Hapsidospora chrysogenum ATCC 11550]
MYELFLTALVEDADFKAACSVLSGLCGMAPWESVTRVLYFQGPPKPSGISNHSSLEKPFRKDTAYLLKELHQSLSRQSFIIQARYEILKDRDMGPTAAPADLDSTPGMLRWTDFPDPPHGRPNITQRKKIEVWEQKKIPTLLSDNSYTFKTENLEEIYRFYRDDIEYCLFRQYFVRPIDDYMPLEHRNTQPSPPHSTLPAWESLVPVDSQDRWILMVKAHVVQDNKPDEIRKAQDQLLSIRGELDGVFDFRAIDRKVHDTRVAQQQQGVQVLPQKVTLGKV